MLPAALTALLLASGCGGSASGGEVSVQTGSLSKAEFIKRADAICAAARSQFTREYTAFTQQHKSDRSNQSALQSELVETILIPNFEKDLDEISALGAPGGEVQEVESFLKSLQKRLDEIHEQPAELNKTAYPLAKPAKVAKAYGLTGCAESLS